MSRLVILDVLGGKGGRPFLPLSHNKAASQILRDVVACRCELTGTIGPG